METNKLELELELERNESFKAGFQGFLSEQKRF